MMKKLTLILLSLLIMSTQSFAQVVIKDCGGGVTVGGNDTCPSSNRSGSNQGGGVINVLTPRWGAIAIDTSPRHVSYGGGSNTLGQKQANAEALAGCREKSATCEVVLEFKNTCGAIAFAEGTGGRWFWTTGVHVDADQADKLALTACERKRGVQKQAYTMCKMGVTAQCAGTPGRLSNSK